MQLCEFCLAYDRCDLVKRIDENPFASCESFERDKQGHYTLTQKRYEKIKTQLLKLKPAAGPGPVIRPTIENKVPTALEAGEYWPVDKDLYLDFYNCCFSNEKDRSKFVEKHCKDPDIIFYGACSPDNHGHETMLIVQDQLRKVIDAYKGGHDAFRGGPIREQFNPLHWLNEWLGRLSLAVEPHPLFSDLEEPTDFDTPYPRAAYSDDFPPAWSWRADWAYEGKWGLRTMPQPRKEPYSQYGLLFLQFVEVVLSEQELKRCLNPKCRKLLVPVDRKNASPVCRRCRSWWHKGQKKT